MYYLETQIRKKKVIFHLKCKEEFMELDREVQIKFLELIKGLEKSGFLLEPYAKKLEGKSNIFELRLKFKGNWRIFYAYIYDSKILMLHLIHKKTQKTNTKDIRLAIKRLKEYEKQH